MTPAPIPASENERLADLTALKILDTPPEERFDRIVRIAKGVFRVPMAYIALVDRNRQWFKAKAGLDADETPRDVSFCGHTILQHEALVIPDAREDARFHDNPMVIGPPHVRFYAGYPLKGPSGQNVGTLCIVDHAPRNLDEHERWLLRELAAMAEHELGLMDTIEAQRALLDTRQQLIESQRHLAEELAQAAAYVASLLPARLTGPIATDHLLVSSSQLGGDLFGYHWLDDDRFALYLLDVCGHGVGAALLSVSVQHALRTQTLPGVRFDAPDEVLTALNRTFPMEAHDGRFFTIWYGVYDRRIGELRYASAGHPPALLFDAEGNETRLGCANLIAGVDADTTYDLHTHLMAAGSRLYLFSDGVYEAEQADGRLLGLEGLAELLKSAPPGGSLVEQVYEEVCRRHGSRALADDFSLVEIRFEEKTGR